jgi:hypothetical protein
MPACVRRCNNPGHLWLTKVLAIYAFRILDPSNTYGQNLAWQIRAQTKQNKGPINTRRKPLEPSLQSLSNCPSLPYMWARSTLMHMSPSSLARSREDNSATQGGCPTSISSSPINVPDLTLRSTYAITVQMSMLCIYACMPALWQYAYAAYNLSELWLSSTTSTLASFRGCFLPKKFSTHHIGYLDTCIEY